MLLCGAKCKKMSEKEIKNCLGNWELSLDSKGRISIPAKMKEKFPANFKNFVLIRGFENDKCIYMYYPENFNEYVFNKFGFANVDVFNDKERSFKRKILSSVSEVEPDNTDRILLPKNLIEYADISKNVVISGAGEYFEIWEKAHFDKKQNEMTEGDLKEIQQTFSDRLNKKNDK